MSSVSYFTAVIAADSTGWRTRDVDVEDAADLEDLAETLRGLGRGQRPVLAVIEHEDEWFALVRVDGDAEPRVFVSDALAASRGLFADLLAPAQEVESVLVPSGAGVGVGRAAGGRASTYYDEDDVLDPDPVEEASTDDAEPVVGEEVEVDLGDLEVDDPVPPPPWAGHADLLVDLGVPAGVMIELCEEHSDDPATVLAELGEQAGFAELLEALR